MSNSNVIYKWGWEHGEPGGASGMPIRRTRHTEPVSFLPHHALKNDPEATPLIEPYTGSPVDPIWEGFGQGPAYE